jgi:antitoxin component of RelBE/YafQ-DinJ toxin-antitoxin module
VAEKRHFSFRLEEDTAEALDRYAKAHAMTRAQVVEALIKGATDAQEAPQQASKKQDGQQGNKETLEALKDNIADLRRQQETLRAQLAEKDRQLTSLAEIANHAQALQAAEKQLSSTSEDTDEEGKSKRPRLKERLGRWLMKGTKDDGPIHDS